MQTDLFDRAKKFRDANTARGRLLRRVQEADRGAGRLPLAHWDGTRETEDRIAAETKATIRCIPFDRKKEAGKCMVTGQPSEGRVVFAKAY